MILDMGQLDEPERYKLLTGAVTPRPIAWLTTRSGAGVLNAAPYSFFNVMAATPPLVAIGLMGRPSGEHKDSAANILETGEFVVNVVTQQNALAMNETSIDAPADYDELAAAGIELAPSVFVGPPRIRQSPVNMECRVFDSVPLPAGGLIVIGEVMMFHVDDDYIDPSNLRIDGSRLGLVGRLNGPSLYCRTTDQFSMIRPKFGQPA